MKFPWSSFGKKPADPPTTTVPADHEVSMVHARLVGGVSRTPGGAVVVNTPLGDDEPLQTLEGLLDQLEAMLHAPSPTVCLVSAPTTTSGLFAPAEPAVEHASGLTVWLLQHGCLNAWLEDPEAFQRLLRRLYSLSRGRVNVAYLCGECGLPDSVLGLLVGIGWPLHRPAGKDCLVEVKRPSGPILVAKPGTLQPVRNAVDRRPMYEALDRAETIGDKEGLSRLLAEDRAWIQPRIAPLSDEEPEYAPKLCRLLEAGQRQDSDRKALYEELLQRRVPLLMLVDPKTKAVAARSWGEFSALPAYPDRASVLWLVQDTRYQGQIATMSMTPRRLFQWAQEQQTAVAICVYLTRQNPQYFLIPPESVRVLADGKVPRS